MTEKRSFDAIFVGGGVIGLSCAWRAAQRGARVAVLDRAEPPAGATRVAAGMLAPVGELAFGEPELLEMTLASAQLYPKFVAELEAATGEATGYASQGALHIALDRDEAAELRRIHDLQRSLGLEAEWLPPRRCRDLEPGLTPSFNGGVHAPGEAAVDPRALTGALLAALDAAGAELWIAAAAIGGATANGTQVRRPGEVVAGLFEGERLVGVRTAAGEELRAPAVVLAAGAWSGQAEWLPEPARPPVRPVKGQILELRSRDGAAPCERIVASERVYLVPRPDGRLIVGATSEEQGFDTAVTAGGVHELLREAYRLLPDVAEMELVAAMAGLRPGTPDNLPLIGPGAIEGLVLATGHYRNGILLAPLTADAIAALLAGEQLPEAVAPAHPARLSFVTQRVTKDMGTSGGGVPDAVPDRASELAARGAALAAAAEAAERAAEEPR
ncbi:MAG: glycine oxidase [Solirubrobacterales bacterium]|nr:glycine oxidase [Solirubrobacterales bacterium]